MFGRFRPPPSSPDCLERSPAKIIKDDPLSVYESTLLKLKQGSRLNIGPCPETSYETEAENAPSPDSAERADPSTSSDTRHSHVTLLHVHETMVIDSGSDGQESGESSKQPKNKNPSVLGMFCRYNDLIRARSMSREEDTMTENALCSRVSADV
ncbi:PREDICTED: uncharacterized protein LOC104821506 [Tarenaya hassleriana]|uniref:uncharacterized protein LOC104821506 n=1 Tax=Tarenaya hassleriana TaxID=28532 RepID=UPI00053C7D40|nr:PREDICTED: uncharacterized protein LOC104821506 [Tarenaya hassleriana]